MNKVFQYKKRLFKIKNKTVYKIFKIINCPIIFFIILSLNLLIYQRVKIFVFDVLFDIDLH